MILNHIDSYNDELKTLEIYRIQQRFINQNIYQSAGMEDLNEINVVDEFPLKNISEGDYFTFSNSVAFKVTNLTHGIHTYPAKFIPHIPRCAFKYSNLKEGSVVFDPFVGCVTTLVEARLHKLNSLGTEINPLGRSLSEVKSNPIFEESPKAIFAYTNQLLDKIKNDKKEILINDINNLPKNWHFWFPEKLLKDIIRIKKNILIFRPSTLKPIKEPDLEKLRKLYLVTLSSIIKKASYLDESQIKVFKKKEKFKQGYPNVINLFKQAIEKNQKGVYEFTKYIRYDKKYAKIIGNDARNVDLEDSSVDLIVTSPPYINAIDYPMAHKYSLFLLNLVDVEDYKKHCRDYIGMTERAVKSSDYSELKLTGFEEIDNKIRKIFKNGSSTDKNRAFILHQYFSGMKTAFKEFHRILKNNSNFIIVVGDNQIRGEHIPTAVFLEKVATSEGFKKVVSFRHYYKNVRLKIN